MAVAKAPPGFFTILYFASAGSYTKKESEILKAPMPLKNLFASLEERYIGIKQEILDSSMVTVNLEYVEDTAADSFLIKEGDEVAIVPPVSSG